MPESAPHTPTLDDVFAHTDDVVARRISGECLLVPLARRSAALDAVYNLNRVGAFIWDRIDGARPAAAIAADVAAHFDVEPRRAAMDLREFAALLLSIGAIRVAGTSAG